MAPDGSFLVFASNRPHDGSNEPLDGHWNGESYPASGGDLWMVRRHGDGWSAPVRLPDVINSCNAVFSPSIVGDGSLYFMKPAGRLAAVASRARPYESAREILSVAARGLLQILGGARS